MEILEQLGFFGLFIGSFLAATIIPFSSDVLLVGILVAGADPFVSLGVATAGNWLGGMTSYYIGRIGKWEWIEKWFKVSEEKLRRQKSKIDKYGALLALLTWLPFVGDVFAIGLGFYRTDAVKTAFFMLVGKGLRFLFWVMLYMRFGEAVLDFFS